MIRNPLPHLVLVGAWLIAGCSNGERRQDAEFQTLRTAAQGDFKLELAVSDDDVSFKDRILIRIDASAPPDSVVVIDDYLSMIREKGLGFELAAHNVRQEAPDENTAQDPWRWRQLLEVEFVLPGEYELPAANATFARPGTDESESAELSTEAVTVVARDPSSQPLPQEELANIPVLDPVELPSPWGPWWWAGPLMALALVALLVFRRPLAGLLRRLKEERPISVPLIPADVWARQQLESLMKEKLLDGGMIQEFHYRISFIVRGYIERRFGVLAAEMTTEEFLATAVSDARFGPDITVELRRFMDACDMVKYARHEATADESMTVVRAAEGFVDRTTVDSAAVASPDGDASRNQGEMRT